MRVSGTMLTPLSMSRSILVGPEVEVLSVGPADQAEVLPPVALDDLHRVL